MKAINLSNEAKRNAHVGIEPKNGNIATKTVHAGGKQHENVRLLKATINTVVDRLQAQYGEDLTDTILNSDAEVDIERVGMRLQRTKKVYIDAQGRIAHRLTFREAVFGVDGVEKEERKPQDLDANINVDAPVRWTGKLIPIDKAVKMFVFAQTHQLKHLDGLSYDFLYDMAKMLHEKRAMMLLGAGVKGVGPLVFSRGATPYRAFLSGRIDGEKYCLLLHLTNLELKQI